MHAKSLQLCLTVRPYGLQFTRLLCSWDSPGKSTGVECHALLQGIFTTQVLNPYLLSPALAGGFFTTNATWEFHFCLSDQISRSVVSDCLRPHESQHARPPYPSPTPGVYSNSCPLSWWCHLTISSSVAPFSSCLRSFPASGSFQRVSSSHQVAKVLEFKLQHQFFQWNIQDWFPLGWTGWISLQSKGLSRVFSNTTLQNHQFFGTQLSL